MGQLLSFEEANVSDINIFNFNDFIKNDFVTKYLTVVIY